MSARSPTSRPGQTGEVVFGAIPERAFGLVVDEIIPVALARDGRNMFRVEAHLSETSDSLRPGMNGVGKIDIGERKLIDIWTRPILEWVELTLWRFVG